MSNTNIEKAKEARKNIEGAIDWMDTDEGFDYWNDVHENLFKYIKREEEKDIVRSIEKFKDNLDSFYEEIPKKVNRDKLTDGFSDFLIIELPENILNKIIEKKSDKKG
ncbi:MAG: hypothetical protein ACOCRX_08690 [Candidatus Woesearchaeota archaeon]